MGGRGALLVPPGMEFSGMAKKSSWWDRIFSFIAWAVIAAIPIAILKIFWDEKYINAKILEDVGNSPLIMGWGLVFLALLIFMWKNERINRGIADKDEKLEELQQQLKQQHREISDLKEHNTMKDDIYQQKVNQLYDDIERQVQRRLLLAQQSSNQQAAEKSRLLELRSRRLNQMKENLPLLQELHSLSQQLQNLQAQIMTDAGVRLLAPDEIMPSVIDLTVRAERRIILVTRQVRGEALIALDQKLTAFWEKGGTLQLWFDTSTEALRDLIDMSALMEWWGRRARQIECWGYRNPLPRLLTIDGREGLILSGDLLGNNPEAWNDFATQVLAEGLAADIDVYLQERMVNPELEPGRLCLHVGGWESYSDRNDHGIIMVTGVDREIYLGLENYKLLNQDFAQRLRAERVQFLLVENNQYGRYTYLAHNFLSPDPAREPQITAPQLDEQLPF